MPMMIMLMNKSPELSHAIQTRPLKQYAHRLRWKCVDTNFLNKIHYQTIPYGQIIINYTSICVCAHRVLVVVRVRTVYIRLIASRSQESARTTRGSAYKWWCSFASAIRDIVVGVRICVYFNYMRAMLAVGLLAVGDLSTTTVAPRVKVYYK